MAGQHDSLFTAAVAAIGTGVWALLAARASLLTMMAAVSMIGVATLVVTIAAVLFDTTSSTADGKQLDFAQAVTMALVFAAYQSAAYAAFSANGALSQAVINCNIVVVAGYTIATADSITTDALATAAACVLYMALGAFIATH